MDPLVSIIVPSYRQAAFLPDALESIFAQGYKPLEVLVLDGGSTDGTVEILEGYGDRIWYRTGPDGGQCQAINEGFRRSRGEIVAWLNSDDFYYPGAIRKAVETLAREPEAGLVYGEGNLVDVRGETMWRFPFTTPYNLWRLARVEDYILQPTVFFRRDTLMRWGLLDEGLNWSLDWDLWLRLGRHTPFACTDHLMAASRIHDATKTATGGWPRLAEIVRMLRRHGGGALTPAGVAHTLTTLVRGWRPAEAPVEADDIAGGLPRILGRPLRPLLRWAEYRARRWLQNTQGLWPDGLAGRRARLWLPGDGRAGALVLQGTNLEVGAQRVTARCGGRSATTGPLEPGERFELTLPLDAPAPPIRVALGCAATRSAPPLDPDLGRRRAGWRLDSWRVEVA